MPGGARVVVLGARNTHTRGNTSSNAVTEAKDIINHRGTTPRIYKNVLVFLSADARALDILKDAVRSALAWSKIVQDKDRHDLTQSDLSRAKAEDTEAKAILDTRLMESWCWIICPSQVSAHEEIEFSTARLSPQDRPFDQIEKKLRDDGALYSILGPATLNKYLEEYIWHDKPHILTSALADYHSRFVYMPRLTDTSVLQNTILSAISEVVPGQFAYAEKFDTETETYLGLVIKGGIRASVAITPDSVIVRPNIA